MTECEVIKICEDCGYRGQMSDSYPWFMCRRTGDEVHADDPACANFSDLYGEEEVHDQR